MAKTPPKKGIPTWVWLAGAGAGLVVAYILYKRSQSSTSSATSSSPTTSPGTYNITEGPYLYYPTASSSSGSSSTPAPSGGGSGSSGSGSNSGGGYPAMGFGPTGTGGSSGSSPAPVATQPPSSTGSQGCPPGKPMIASRCGPVVCVNGQWQLPKCPPQGKHKPGRTGPPVRREYKPPKKKKKDVIPNWSGKGRTI